jgi:arylsulfatase A
MQLPIKNHLMPYKLFSGLIVPGLILSSCGEGPKEKIADSALPNIIYILADDLGFGDVSYQGQKKFSTPNIDRLAAEGLIFTDHYSGSTVCAPSRSSLMTGLHTGNTFIRGNLEIQPEGQYPLPSDTFTLPKMLQSAGYVTGAFGKWGLGYPGSEGDPVNQGFDVFFGFNCQRLGHHYYPYHLWHNQEKIILEGNAGKATGQYAPNVIHEEALRFIETNKDKPFFMYYPSIIPHAELFAPEEYMEKYRGKFLPEMDYKGYDEGPLFRLGPYGSQPESHAAHAAMINVLDDQVGEIVDKLKELGIAGNTIIIFTSDNGPHSEGGADPDFFNNNNPFRGYKRDLYEGGIRVPMVAYWPGKILPGRKTNHISAFWDVLPTLAEIAGVEPEYPVDGISFKPTLLGEGNQKEHEYLYWEFHEHGGKQAVRMGDWKLVVTNVLTRDNMNVELFNLSDDIAETKNLSASHPELTDRLFKVISSARTSSEIFTFKSETIIQ